MSLSVAQVVTSGRSMQGVPPAVSGFAVGADAAADLRIDLPLDRVSFRAVTSAAQLRQIAHLRDAIALPADLRQSPAFAQVEKKETN